MMQMMRKAGQTWIAKTLFILLVLSFAVWGIGPIFSGGRVQTAATAGKVDITATQVEEAFRLQLQLIERQYGLSMSSEQAAQLGLKRQIAQQLVMQALYSQEAARMGIIFSRDMVKQSIATQPALRDESGQFDKARFQGLLQQLGMTEAGYLQALNEDLTRTLLVGSIQSSMFVPDQLAKPIYTWSQEKRTVEALEVKATDIRNIADPTAEELEAFYKSNSDAYMAPEYRSFSYVILDREKIGSSLNPTEEELKAAYEQAPDEYGAPEKRTIAQITTRDAELAQKIAAEAAGKSLQEVAKANGASYSEIADIAKGSTFPKLGEAIFALESGQTSAAIESPMGWHVLQLVKITPAVAPEFAAVREQVLANWRRTQAEEKVYELSTKLQDAVAGGATLAEAAEQLKLPLGKRENISAEGKLMDGSSPPADVSMARILPLAFVTTEGEASPVQETDTGGFVVAVDKVTSAQAKPLESIRTQVVSDWRAARQLEKAVERAKEQAEKINAGESVSGLSRIAGLLRDGSNRDKLPSGAIAAIFNAEPGKAVTFNTETGSWVLKVAGSEKPDLAGADLKGVRDELRQQLNTDILEQFGTALRESYGAELNEAWLASQNLSATP
jgi:peptidyl-prolyl cis-trans isomerase D